MSGCETRGGGLKEAVRYSEQGLGRAEEAARRPPTLASLHTPLE